MIWEAIRGEQMEGEGLPYALGLRQLLLLSIATSVDALAAGVGFSVIQMDFIYPVVVIGFVTFVLSMAGLRFGKTLGYLLARRAELLGGVILIVIGAHICYQHIRFGI